MLAMGASRMPFRSYHLNYDVFHSNLHDAITAVKEV
jgi:hypothetical protein